MRFLNSNCFTKISDETTDPLPAKYSNNSIGSWTEGYFEFRITVLINSKNGVGNEYVRNITVNASDLFDITYKKIFGNYYIYQSVTPKEYKPFLEILPWDLQSYGIAWKFIFHEIDASQEVTQSYENTTTYVSNFEGNVGIDLGVFKIGGKGGSTETTVDKKTFTVKTTLTSDFLGEAILTFDQPIITGTYPGTNNFITREISTGLLSISVEPWKMW
jgi:hypothetical protein